MSDVIDQMAERNERMDAATVEAVRANAELVPGEPGDCDLCGEWSGRIVRGACAPCRDKWKLP